MKGYRTEPLPQKRVVCSAVAGPTTRGRLRLAGDPIGLVFALAIQPLKRVASCNPLLAGR
jgi:hypothetical protein